MLWCFNMKNKVITVLKLALKILHAAVNFLSFGHFCSCKEKNGSDCNCSEQKEGKQ